MRWPKRWPMACRLWVFAALPESLNSSRMARPDGSPTAQDDENSLAKALDEAMADGPERARRAANAVEKMAGYAPETQFDRWANLIRATAREL